MSLFRSIKEYFANADGVEVHGDGRMKLIVWALKSQCMNIFSKNWKFRIYTIFSAMIVGTISFNGYVYMFRKVAMGDLQFPADIELFTTPPTQSMGLFHLMVMLFRREDWRIVYNTLFIKLYKYIEGDEKKVALFKKASTRGNFLHTWFLCQVIGTLIILWSIPIIMGTLPLDGNIAAIPYFGYSGTPLYQITWALQAFTMTVTDTHTYFLDALFLVTLMHIYAHMHILGEDIQSMKYMTRKEDVSRMIRQFVERYDDLIICLDKITKIYSPKNYLLPSYITVIVLACAIAANGSRETTMFVIMGYAHALILFNYCYAAEVVVAESADLLHKVAWCGWEQFDQPNKKNVLILLNRLQKPVMLRAGFSGGFTLEVFGNTMKTCYSVYATLNSVK